MAPHETRVYVYPAPVVIVPMTFSTFVPSVVAQIGYDRIVRSTYVPGPAK